MHPVLLPVVCRCDRVPLAGDLLPSKEICDRNKDRIKQFEAQGSKPSDVEGTRLFAECQMRQKVGDPRRAMSMLAILQEEGAINLEEFTELAHSQLKGPRHVSCLGPFATMSVYRSAARCRWLKGMPTRPLAVGSVDGRDVSAGVHLCRHPEADSRLSPQRLKLEKREADHARRHHLPQETWYVLDAMQRNVLRRAHVTIST